MKRRGLLAAAGAALGCAAAAQARPPRIGMLVALAPPAPGDWDRAAELKAALAALGLREGEHYELHVRHAEQPAALDAAARELVALEPRLIVANLTPAGLAAARTTQRIPIVLAGVAEAVANGLVQSLARPGGNVTGITVLGADLAAKNLELLREWLPGARRLGMLLNRVDPFNVQLRQALQGAARVTRFEPVEAAVDGAAGVSAALDAWRTQRIDAAFVQPSLPFAPAIAPALAQRWPLFSFVHSMPRRGGLFAYGAPNSALWPPAAGYVQRILAGAAPADLPVQVPTHFELVVNAGTARAIGLALPASIRLRAAEVVE